MLGYTQVSWDNASGNERKPLAARKKWASLTDNEKLAVGLLGFTEMSWSTGLGYTIRSSSSIDKRWSELTVCTDGEDIFFVQPLSY